MIFPLRFVDNSGDISAFCTIQVSSVYESALHSLIADLVESSCSDLSDKKKKIKNKKLYVYSEKIGVR